LVQQLLLVTYRYASSLCCSVRRSTGGLSETLMITEGLGHHAALWRLQKKIE
jgi:hypothetical protein